MDSMKVYLLLLCGLIVLAQSIFMFIDARKNGFNQWTWGILGLIQSPIPLILYLIVKHIRKKEEDELNDYRDY